jgi:predicted NBD/HSP70 family sugar kinase
VPFVESFHLEQRLRARRYRLATPPSGMRADRIAALGARAHSGDATATTVLREQAEHFAEALVRLSLLLDPEMLVLAGDFTAAGKEWERALRHHFRREYARQVHIPPKTVPRVTFSRLGQDVVVLGGASAMIRRIMNERIQGGGASAIPPRN